MHEATSVFWIVPVERKTIYMYFTLFGWWKRTTKVGTLNMHKHAQENTLQLTIGLQVFYNNYTTNSKDSTIRCMIYLN